MPGDPRHTQPARIPMTDNSARNHIASSDPGFPAKREAAVQIICDAISAVALPMGYAQTGTTWARDSAAGKTAINLQRSRYGFEAYINLRFLTPDGELPKTAIWQDGDDLRLDRFYLPDEAPENGVLTYLDVIADPACMTLPMTVLCERALPWLDAHHTA